MSYTPTVQDYELLTRHNKEQKVKLVFLDKNTFISYGEIQADLISYSLDVDGNSDYRRILSLDIAINTSDLPLFKKNAVLLDRVIQMYIGMSDNRNNMRRYLVGTFAFTDKTYTYNASTNQLSINCTDMTAYLNGDLGGNIIGANSTTIYAYQDNLPYGKVKVIYDENGILNSTYFSPNTKLTLPLPYNIYDTAYNFDLTAHQCGHRNKGNIGDYGGHVAIVLNKSKNVTLENNAFAICDVQNNIITNISPNNNDTCFYYLNDTSGSELLITALYGVNIDRIAVYDYFVSRDNPVVVWNFGQTYNLSDDLSSVYPAKQPFNTYNVLGTSKINTLSNALTDIHLQDERFTKYAIGSIDTSKLEATANRGYDYDYTTNHAKSYYMTQPMVATIDTLEGKAVTIKEVVAALLKASNITKYNIDDITEVIPYDQEFSSPTNYFEIIKQITSLYEDIEVFFDVDGTFVMRHIPTTDDAPYILTDTVLKPLVIEEKYNEDLTSFHNVTEVWGNQIDADYYATNSLEQTLVTYDKTYNCINAVYENIGVTDEGKIIDGTVLALLTPDNITNHPSGISMCVNNMGGATIDTTNIQVTKLWQVDDDLYWDHLEQFLHLSANNGMDYNDVCFYGYPMRPGEDNPQYIILKDDIPLYGIIDGINFSYYADYAHKTGTFDNPYCDALMFIRPNYIYDEKSGIKKLNTTEPTSCIKFKAKRGEVVRFYFTYKPELSIADAQGNILTTQTSSTNIDNKISYMDFYPLTELNETYYVFDGITNNTIVDYDGSCAAIFGMSKFTYKFPTLPIKDMYTDEPLTQGYLEPNTSYCFQYSANTL